MTENKTTNLTDIVTFILTSASDDDLNAIYDAAKSRSRTLRDIKAATVKVGDDVITENISPKYLCGLTGKVTAKRGARVDVELDEDSTRLLRFKGGRRFYVADDVKNYTIKGVPASCAVTK